jgi:hypothetical protein
MSGRAQYSSSFGLLLHFGFIGKRALPVLCTPTTAAFIGRLGFGPTYREPRPYAPRGVMHPTVSEPSRAQPRNEAVGALGLPPAPQATTMRPICDHDIAARA